MKEELGRKPDLKVMIRCDKESKHLHLANVMSICRHIGVLEANIAVRTEN
jgi:biopolymer transport protein ExbD